MLPLEDDQNSSIASIDCKANNKLHRSPAQAKKQETILEEKLFRQIQRIFFGMKRYQPYFAVKWFRRLNKKEAKVLEIGNLTIDPERFIIQVDKNDIVLAKKEFELLHLLASKPGRVFLRNEILSQVWGNDVIVGDRTIDVHIRKIRQKLGLDCITTVKGVGYKFEM